MKKVIFSQLFVWIHFIGFSQNLNQAKTLQIPIADTIPHPMIVVLHSMGDINVQGTKGDELLVYTQELLPSVSELLSKKNTQSFQFINSRTKSPVTVRRNSNFSVKQSENLFQIETNLYSYNSDVFVIAPSRSSISVNSRDRGNISIENFVGDVEAIGHAGSIFIRNVDGVISAETTYGNVIADLENKMPNKPLFISTFLGNIEIIVPKKSKNSVILSSEMGNLHSNFDTMKPVRVGTHRNRHRNRKFTFDLNGGGTEFVLNTFKGDIYLRHPE